MTQHPDTSRPEEYLARHDWTGVDTLYESIVNAVAAATNTETDTVAAHYDEGHSRTVERLFADPDAPRSYGLVRFTLGDAVVTVHSDGRLVVASPGDDAARRPAVA